MLLCEQILGSYGLKKLVRKRALATREACLLYLLGLMVVCISIFLVGEAEWGSDSFPGGGGGVCY